MRYLVGQSTYWDPGFFRNLSIMLERNNAVSEIQNPKMNQLLQSSNHHQKSSLEVLQVPTKVASKATPTDGGSGTHGSSLWHCP
uniref:Uncharacterized protein n=1 Tax=Arundo donax TaxID=35708 RepID=A0A0A9CZL5_ARUDO